MNAGTVAVGLALALGVAAFASGLLRPAWTRRLLAGHAAAATLALLILLVAFLAVDLSYAYVWGHTAVGYPLAYRVSGIWGGEEGTILLWNAGVAVCAWLVGRGAGELRRRAALALALFSSALAGMSLLVGTFAPTTARELALAPAGRGLADVLLTPLMVVHPPVQFVAYALLAVPAAFALARWSMRHDGDRTWAALAYPWARIAWLFATLGLGLGALWAYYVLSFGGYWAWDPVETSNLLPWLALTALLHAAKHHERHGDFVLAAPALAALAWLLTLFATFATRSGLWTSVHAFTDPTSRFEPDAALRMLAIVEVHAPTRAFLALLTAGLFASVALFLLHHAMAMRVPTRRYATIHATALLALAGGGLLDPRALHGLVFAAADLVGIAIGLPLAWGLLVGAPFLIVWLDREDGAGRLTDARRAMSVAVALFALAIAAAFVVNVQVVNGPDRAAFDVRAPYVVLPMVSALTVMMALGPLGRARAIGLAAAGALAGVTAWTGFPEARVVALATPFLLAALAAVALRLAHVMGRGATWTLRAAGALLLASGILAIATWANPPTRAFGLDLSAAPGVPLAILGMLLGAVALVGAIACFRARGAPLAFAGAAAGALAMGFGVGAALALLAGALAFMERARFTPSVGFARSEAVRLRELGIHVIHVAVVLGLLGYAASTYSQSRETFVAAAPGDTLAVGPYAFSLGAPDGDVVDGALHAIRVPVALERDGNDVGTTSLDFAWRGAPASHYAARLDVGRTLTEDVYLSPLAVKVGDAWVGGSSAGSRVPDGPVTAVTFTASVLPLVGLVWAGLWLGLIGMGFVLAGTMFLRLPQHVAVGGRPQKLEERPPLLRER